MRRRRRRKPRQLPAVSDISDAIRKQAASKIRNEIDQSIPPFDPQPEKKPEPTHYPPGSLEKISVLRKRAEQDEELWHDNDACH